MEVEADAVSRAEGDVLDHPQRADIVTSCGDHRSLAVDAHASWVPVALVTPASHGCVSVWGAARAHTIEGGVNVSWTVSRQGAGSCAFSET